MSKVAFAFLTKDRVELSKRTIAPLFNGPDTLHWIDGSATEEGRDFHEWCWQPGGGVLHRDIRGGADAAIVYALTTMLADPNNTHLGLCENDVLLSPDWFEQTMDLFAKGGEKGLNVGAASPRCYEDRILIQRDGYAIMHNLGAGVVIFTREAARLILDHYRTAWSIDNRNIFCQLSGIDIGIYWAFRANPQWLTADWGFDAILARSGLASLALTPSPVEMIGQTPSLAEQGLALAAQPIERLRNDAAFDTYRSRLASLWEGKSDIAVSPAIHQDLLGNFTIFPHQVPKLNGSYAGDWRLKWTQGFGPFSWRAASPGDSLTVLLAGHCNLLVSGGAAGAQVEIVDDHSGFTCNPVLPPEGPATQVMAIAVPGNVTYREVRLTALTPGVVFYGIGTREPQMLYHEFRFNHAMLPPV